MSLSPGSPGSPARTAIIGAGSSGLAVLKALLEAGVPATCFERGSQVGGNWVFDNDNGQSRIYRSLTINTSRERMQFSDFPMPRECPDYPGHAQIRAYFSAYAEHFGLARAIAFRSPVSRVEPASGGYLVTAGGAEPERFDAVIVANGHHWDPRWPEPAPSGEFTGQVLHSHAYVAPDEPYALRGRRVVVVGIGNSACDIACELGRAGSDVTLSVRRGAWVLPKYVFGKPLDQGRLIPGFFPQAVRTALAEAWYALAVGQSEDFGLPRPDHHLGHAHPTVSSELLPLLKAGRIRVRPAIERLQGERVHFADGTAESCDAIVYCTGYKVSFPFFDPSFVAAPSNELPLFLRGFHLEHERLLFAGLCQPLGAVMPLAEAQGVLFARYLSGRYALPARSEMRAHALRERAAVRKRYGTSPRHTMQVDFDGYLRTLERETRAGEGRAERPVASSSVTHGHGG